MQTIKIPKKNTNTAAPVSDDDVKISDTKSASLYPPNIKKDDDSINNENDPWSFDPWGADPWSSKSSNEPSSSTSTKLSPQDRVKMITEVYELVLGREPDTRDINYYKYSTLDKSEIITQLLEGKEHKKLVEDGNQFTKTRNRAEQAEIRAKVLENQIKDQVEEFKELTILLEEKNRQIQNMRSKMKNPYAFTNDARMAIELNKERSNTTYSGINMKKETSVHSNEIGVDESNEEGSPQVFNSVVRPVESQKESFLTFVINKIRELIS